MTDTKSLSPTSRRRGWVAGLVVGVLLCGGVLVCLAGLGAWGGVAYVASRATAQADQAKLAQVIETATALAREVARQQATQTAAALQVQQVTARAQTAVAGTTATAQVKWAASTSTAQARIEASTATASARATAATPTPADPRLAWPASLYDAFDANTQGWFVDPYKDDYGIVTRTIQAGKYRWEADTTEGRLWRANCPGATFRDGYVAVDVRLVAGDANTRYGLVVRDDGSNYYYFDAGTSRTFGFYLWHNGQWTTLVDLTQAAELSAQGVNRLGVLAQGSAFTLYINDEVVARVTDSHLAEGLPGLGVNLSRNTPPAIYEFDNFEVRAP